MGDYNTPELYSSQNIQTEFTKEYSTIGEKSLKIISNSTGENCGYLITTTTYSGKTIKLTADVKTTNSTWKLEFMGDSNGWSGDSVSVSPGKSSPSILFEVKVGTTRVLLRLKQSGGSIGDIIYTDNWRLMIIQ